MGSRQRCLKKFKKQLTKYNHEWDGLPGVHFWEFGTPPLDEHKGSGPAALTTPAQNETKIDPGNPSNYLGPRGANIDLPGPNSGLSKTSYIVVWPEVMT